MTPRQRVIRAVQIVVGLAVAVFLIGWVLPWVTHTPWHVVAHTLRRIPAERAWLLFGIMVAALWLCTFTLAGSLPKLGHVRALVLNICGSSIGNVMPAGGAFGVAITWKLLRSWGFRRPAITASIIVSGIWNLLARLALPVIAIVFAVIWWPQLDPSVVRAATVGSCLMLVALGLIVAFLASDRFSAWLAAQVGRLVNTVSRGRVDADRMGAHALGQRAIMSSVIRSGWLSMTVGMVGYFGANYLLFWLCFQSIGTPLPWVQMFCAFAVSRMLTAIGITPGGVGFSETGVAGILMLWGMAPHEAFAGVILYSLYVHVLEVPLGLVSWTAWWFMPRPGPPADEAAPAHGATAGSGSDPERDQAPAPISSSSEPTTG